MRRALPWLIGLALWASLPALLARHYVDLLVFAGLYTVAGLGVSFLLGHCGIVTMAQSVFYGVGAYSVAYFGATRGFATPIGLCAGLGISGLIALVLGWPVLRLSGYFLALATLSLAVMGQVLFLEWDWLTGGTLGIGGIPRISLFGFELKTPQRFYYLVWVVAFGLIWLQHNLVHSRNGIAMRAMRDSPEAAAALGINLQALKLRMFVTSAVVGSLAGSLFAHYSTFVSPDSFGVDRAVSFLLLAVLGGVQTVWGAAFGALFVTMLPELLSRLGDFHQVLFALCLIATVIFLPEGFGGAIERWWKRRRGMVEG
jgi:branched-chain amino acid transport system permease protein